MLDVGFERFLEFAEAGRVGDEMQIEYAWSSDNELDAVEFATVIEPLSGDAAQANLKAPIASGIKWTCSPRYGLPLAFEQFNEKRGGDHSTYSLQCHLDRYRTGSGKLATLPVAWDELDVRTMPGDLGMHTKRVRAMVLHAEFDEPEHLEHPAFEPDLLADWMGVSLQWVNKAGCQVESHPTASLTNGGVPHCKLLMEIREKVKKGDIKIEWPMDEE